MQAMHDPSTDLIRCLDWSNWENHESVRLHALEIIRSGADIHSVTTKEDTCLHLAVKHHFIDVVQLLLEKGIDVNAQNCYGNTALHQVCTCGNYGIGFQGQTELISMLLYHGADPWIWNKNNATPLDCILNDTSLRIIRNYGVKERALVPTVEHLYRYMVDHYTEFRLSADSLLTVAFYDLPFFEEMVTTIKEVDLDNLATTIDEDIQHILTMPPENLKLLLDKFDYVLLASFLATDDNINFRHLWPDVSPPENVYILVGSHLQREFIDCLCKRKIRRSFLHHTFRFRLLSPPATQDKIVYCLLSYGMDIHGEDIDTIYRYCGNNDLFKLLRFMDVKPRPTDLYRLIPRLVFEVTGTIQKRIEDPRFWIKQMTKLDFDPVLPYYAVPNLKDLFCEVEVEGKEYLLRKLVHQPRIPLLLEMARNVFRKYFIKRLRIRSAKQFYYSLQLLPISSHYRKIIALEIELY